MKIAILSDVHDNAHNLVLALDQVTSYGDVEQIYFLGDFCGAAIANLFCSSTIPVYAIWGNNDGDKCTITKFAADSNTSLGVGFDTYDILTVDGRKLFLTHYPLIAKSMARSGDFDAVFYGHNHTKNKEIINNCLVLNPGEVGAYKSGIGSFAIYDTQTNDAQIVEIVGGITTNTLVAKDKFSSISFRFNKQKGHKLDH